jgi:hypothetical protein
LRIGPIGIFAEDDCVGTGRWSEPTLVIDGKADDQFDIFSGVSEETMRRVVVGGLGDLEALAPESVGDRWVARPSFVVYISTIIWAAPEAEAARSGRPVCGGYLACESLRLCP